jgi:hypothetical protein
MTYTYKTTLQESVVTIAKICIWEITGLNLSQDTGYLEGFLDFTQSLQANTRSNLQTAKNCNSPNPYLTTYAHFPASFGIVTETGSLTIYLYVYIYSRVIATRYERAEIFER